MKINNKKGLEMAIGTVAMIAIVLAVLLVVANFFLRGVGETGGGLEDVAGETGEETESFNVSKSLGTAIAGGECEGSVTEDHCGSYYEEGYPPDTASCEVPSCGVVGCDAPSSPATSGVCEPTGTSISASCEDLAKYGKKLCECAGCRWLPA